MAKDPSVTQVPNFIQTVIVFAVGLRYNRRQAAWFGLKLFKSK
jgi:hypothetical protein